MNAIFPPRTLHWLLLALLAFGIVPLCAGQVSAAEPILQANLIFEFVHDRSRMIQVSLIFVTFGCAIIWWYR